MTNKLFIYQCPKCGMSLHACHGNANRKARCPACGEIHVVPNEEDPFAVGQTDLPDDVADAPSESNPFDFFEDAVAAQPAPNAASNAEDHVRRCPHCGRETHMTDHWTEAVCRTCGTVVPAGVSPENQNATATPRTDSASKPSLPGAAFLLRFVAVSLYVEAAIIGATTVLLLVLEASRNIVVIIVALAGLLLAGFRTAQAQQVSRRNSAFRAIVACSDVLGITGLAVILMLSVRDPHLTFPPVTQWITISSLFVLLAGFRGYVLFHHAKTLFTHKPGK